MSLFYRIAYALGFAPWEDAAIHEAEWFAAAFDREQDERTPPLGRALDLGCGRGIQAVQLARRGWSVTGVELLARPLERARERIARAGVDVELVQADATRLTEAHIGKDFRLVIDFGLFHGLGDADRAAMGREVSGVAAPDATMLMISWRPGFRGPLPRGAGRADIETAFPDWRVIAEDPLDVTALPGLLKSVDPRCYRLRHNPL